MSKRNEIVNPSTESEALRRLRESSGLSIRKLAVLMNLSPTRVHQMEQGRGNISERYLKDCLVALGYSLSEWIKYLNGGEEKAFDLRESCVELLNSIDVEKLDVAYEYLISLRQPASNVEINTLEGSDR